MNRAVFPMHLHIFVHIRGISETLCIFERVFIFPHIWKISVVLRIRYLPLRHHCGAFGRGIRTPGISKDVWQADSEVQLVVSVPRRGVAGETMSRIPTATIQHRTIRPDSTHRDSRKHAVLHDRDRPSVLQRNQRGEPRSDDLSPNKVSNRQGSLTWLRGECSEFAGPTARSSAHSH